MCNTSHLRVNFTHFLFNMNLPNRIFSLLCRPLQRKNHFYIEEQNIYAKKISL